jgi:hypothetical protein
VTGTRPITAPAACTPDIIEPAMPCPARIDAPASSSPRIGVRVLKAMGGRAGVIRKLPVGAGWTEGRDLPAPAGRTFRELYRERQAGARR